jgi:hypothetical protein
MKEESRPLQTLLSALPFVPVEIQVRYNDAFICRILN